MSEPIISVSGLRGIVGDSLTPELAVRYACAFAAGLPADLHRLAGGTTGDPKHEMDRTLDRGVGDQDPVVGDNR